VTVLARERSKYALGSALIVGLVLGGGNSPGLVTDTIIQIVVIVAAAVEFSRPPRSPIPASAWMLVAAVFAAMLVQIVPLPTALLDALRPAVVGSDITRTIGDPGLSTMSLGIGRTIEVLFVAIAIAAMFLAILRLRPEQVVGLLPFFFLGVACNALAAAIQYSVAKSVSIDALLPFEIKAGFFANVNHFSSLLFIAIPLVAYHGVVSGKLKTAAFSIAGILLLLLAAGSRAGVVIGLAVTVLSLVFLVSRSKAGILVVAGAFVALSVYTLGAWTKFGTGELDPAFGRAEFARTTLDGISQNWALGVGYGNFENAYKIYERQEMIFRWFVNHAHNDFLELIFEGGIVAALLLAAYVVLLYGTFWKHRNDALRRMALLSITFLLVHSLVDYPLRTMSLALSFALLNAIVFHAGTFARARARPSMEVDLDGERLLVPIESVAR
jgi:O-antigen ligase